MLISSAPQLAVTIRQLHRIVRRIFKSFSQMMTELISADGNGDPEIDHIYLRDTTGTIKDLTPEKV
jgi:hypothetical protein